MIDSDKTIADIWSDRLINLEDWEVEDEDNNNR